MTKKLIAGNWKMNGTVDGAKALIAGIINNLSLQEDILERADLLVCPPFLHIPAVRHALYGYPRLSFGAQNCADHGADGAYTGDISAKMLKDSSCTYVILGHSERRQYHKEGDALIARKAAQVLANDMIPIICIGESENQREEGQQEEVVTAQLAGSLPKIGEFDQIVIAYEPVWAIGTGKTAEPKDVAQMHNLIRATLKNHVKSPQKVRILYGGSVNPENAAGLLATENVDGALVGGASLKAESFLAIAGAA